MNFSQKRIKVLDDEIKVMEMGMQTEKHTKALNRKVKSLNAERNVELTLLEFWFKQL